ncbi:MAG: phosphoribosylglycinamide formyltransferase [Endomicrobiaceae bacterium]|nr:phosphoribosylglycinamide formyltransferase [Endomicrobiaceae bacterium]
MKKLAVLVSGGGSNLQSIIDQTKNGILKDIAEVVIVISNNPSAYGLERAKKENIKAVALNYKNMDKQDYDNQMYKLIKESGADIICLAGYLKKVSDKIVKEYKSRVLNIHPALLPKFGGKGMYGHFVHEAVVKAKEKKSGPTVHYVDENYDTGSIILQKEVPVYETDTPEDVAKRVLVQEHIIFPQAIKKVIENLK